MFLKKKADMTNELFCNTLDHVFKAEIGLKKCPDCGVILQ
jgi:uncharacterized protein (UPF0212 family)